MSTDNMKEIVRRLIDAHVRHDAERVRQVLSPQLVWHSGGADTELGRDDYLEAMAAGDRAFSDQHVEIAQMVAEGEHIAVLLRLNLRHTGEFQGLAPSGRAIGFTSMWFYRIDADGTIAEAWQIDEDIVGRLHQAAGAAQAR